MSSVPSFASRAPGAGGASHSSSSSAHGAAATAPGPPGGIFQPGTKVQVGESRVIVDRYLSEGGFAHVYVVRLPKPIGGEDKAVLKRVAVPDKEALANMRTEIETMKKLRGHRHIVTYFDSHASQLGNGGYEVFVLMEYCAGGGLIDFMNTRLQNRLTEPEILQIFSHAAQGVACMHYLKPPLIHRDLKVENILISATETTRTYKLCDFGSSAPPRPAASSAAEGRLIEEDVQRHTTMQYRSPEMIDVYRKQPIDEKSDIWALGVFLYKLCYYTTPFEEQGQMAILNASFRFPGHPQFSDRLKRMIAMMLQEKPNRRPNIYQVVSEICSMRKTEVPIKDIYANRTASEARRNQELPPRPGDVKSPPPTVGAVKVQLVEEKQRLPEITPMRRGRPSKATSETPTVKPSPSPRRPVSSDPFAALDSNGTASVSADELSSRFPTLDQFSLLHDPKGAFSFDSAAPQKAAQQPKDLSQRVTDALADDAFAAVTPKTSQPVQAKRTSNASDRTMTGKQTSSESARLEDASKVKKPSMVSTGTMTMPQFEENQTSSPSLRPLYRFPSSDQRASSHSRVTPTLSRNASSTGNEVPALKSQSQTNLISKQAPSFRTGPSPDISTEDTDGNTSAQLRARPISTSFESGSKFLQPYSNVRGTSPRNRGSTDPSFADLNKSPSMEAAIDDSSPRIDSNVEFLRQKEEEEAANKKREKRLSSGSLKHAKRSSLPSISLSGTKNKLAGRFGDAFKRFESNTASGTGEYEDNTFPDSNNLTPIAGSEATDGRSDDGNVLEESEEIPPEMRRELERRRLSQEEKRVAQAAAAYKQRVADGGAGSGGVAGGGKAAAIQSKVQALLDESSKQGAPKTAEGYGRFTNSPNPQQSLPAHMQQQRVGDPPSRTASLPARPAGNPQVTGPSSSDSTPVSSTTGNALRGPMPSGAPSAPGPKPKPQSLRTTGGGAPPVANKPAALAATTRTGPAAHQSQPPPLPKQRQRMAPPSTAIPSLHSSASAAAQLEGAHPAPGAAGDAGLDADWEATFSKKYPRLAGLEMVETEIAAQDATADSFSKASGATGQVWRDI